MILSFLGIYILVSIVNSWLMSHEKNILACGLMGFYPKRGKKCDYKALFLLGCLNENRGTDSCGITIGYDRIIGIKGESVARDFLMVNEKEIKKKLAINKPVIFHTRKSTYGTHTVSNAHPFIWHTKNAKKDYFAFAHNGTLTSYKELIKTYKIEQDEKLVGIDSHVLGLGMYSAIRGYIDEKDIVQKYEGDAAFLCYDEKIFKAWRGAENEVEERPLWMLETEDGWYFHSQPVALYMVFGKSGQSLNNNELITFEDFALKSREIYKRTRKVKHLPARTWDDMYIPYKKEYSIKDPVARNTINNLISLGNIFCTKKEENSKPNIILNKNPLSKQYLKYVYNEIQDFPVTGNIKLGFSKLINNGYKVFPYINETGKEMIFRDGFIIKDEALYQKLKSNFSEYVRNADYLNSRKFLDSNKQLLNNVIEDFIWFKEVADEWTDISLLFFRTSYGAIEYIDANSTNTVQLELMLGDKVFISGSPMDGNFNVKDLEKVY